MSTFVIVDKKSSNEVNVNGSRVELKSPSEVHTKLYREDVAEFIQDGNDLILKLKNGKTVVIANFFVKKDDEESDLIFEDEDCGIPWLPLLLGAGGAAGAAAALSGGGGGSDNGGNGNNAPTVSGNKAQQPISTLENQPKIDKISDVTDPDGDVLTYVLTSQPNNGTVTIDPKTGEYTYIPNPGFNGSDTFTVTIKDGKGGSTTVEVPVTIMPETTVSVDGYEDNVGNAPENIESGRSTNDNTPSISGMAKAATEVEVFINGKSVGMATVSQDGKWKLPELTTALKDGPHTIKAVAKDALGNEVSSNEYTVTVNTTVSAGNPEIVTGTDGSSTITAKVDNPKNLDKIEVLDPNGDPIPGLTVDGPDADGKVTITGTIPKGVVPELVVTDKTGNEKQVPITDKTPAATVSVDGYADNIDGQGKVTTPSNIGSSQSTNDNKPVISGTSTGASRVEVFIDGKSVGEATVEKDGSWQLPELTTELTDGSHTITAKATNGAGKEVGSNEYTVTVDTTVSAGEPELITGKDGSSTITTTVDPKDVTKVEVVDKAGNPIPGLTVNGPDADGKVTITGKIPEGSEPELKVTDGAGNEKSTPIVDSEVPTVNVTIDPNGKVTIDFSEPVKGFDPDKVTTENGKLTGLTQDPNDPTIWTGTFEPAPNFTGEGKVTVPGGYTDLNNNPGQGNEGTTPIVDSEFPTVAVTIDPNGKVTIDFSEPVKGFDPNKVTTENGKLTGLTQDPNDPTIWTGTFEPAPNFTGEGKVTVPGGYTDLNNNPGQGNEGTTPIVDSEVPTVAVTIDPNGKVTIDFSEPVNGFDPNKVTTENGKLTGLTQDPNDPTIWTGTFEPAPNFTGEGKVTVPGGYTDLNNNPGQGNEGTTPIVDSEVPTVAVTIDPNGKVTIDFSEPVKGFDPNKVTTENGKLTGLTQDPNDPTIWTGTFEPAPNFTGEGKVTVPGGYTDLNNNPGQGNEGTTPIVDSEVPMVAVTIDPNGKVTIDFSEPVNGFDPNKVTTENGKLTGLTQDPNDPTIWTGTFEPAPNFTGEGKVTVPGGYTDLNNNPGESASGRTSIDTMPPTVEPASVNTKEDMEGKGTIIVSNSNGDTVTYKLDPENKPTNGTVVIDPETGEYTYTPHENYSGTDSFKVIVDNGKGTTVIEVPVTITPVADAPAATDSMEFNVGELALNKYVWNNIKNKVTIDGRVYDFDDVTNGGGMVGSGINKDVLVNGIDALLKHKVSDATHTTTTELHSGKDADGKLIDNTVDESAAILINGLVYLEAGKTYTYQGKADDTGMIIIGNGLSSQYVSWGGVNSGTHGNDFIVEETGFYDFNLYVYNQSGIGNFDFKVTEENGADVKYYPSPEAASDELPEFIQLDNKHPDGYYGVKYGYAGYETEQIKLDRIHAKLADVDGSETLTVKLSNVPAGTKLIVTSVDKNGVIGTEEVIADSEGNITIIGKNDIVEYKDFVLELPKDAQVGTETVTVEVTAMEESNGDSKSDSFKFDITVKDPADLITTMKVETAGNGDDNIVGLNGSHNVEVGDQGGVQTNFVAGHDYNVAVVLDVSGSMQWNMTYEDKSTPVRIDVAKEGLKLFVKEMVNHQGKINLTLITFEANSKHIGTFEVDQSNLNNILKTIDGIQAGGDTKPSSAFDLANKWFEGQGNSFENQTYYITDGDPRDRESTRDNAFKPLAENSKVFAVGLGEVSIKNVERYDNTDKDGNKIDNWSPVNHGSSQVLKDKEALISYLISGGNSFKPAEAGNDKVTGGNGNDILFGDAINTNDLTWDGRDSVKHPQYSGYSTLIDYLKATVTDGAEPTEQQIYKYLQENYMDFVKADANDPNVKGGNDIIDGGAGNDIIIAGAGNDQVIGSQGNDIISTGAGNDTVIYNLLSGLENDNTGGHGVDTWVDFALGNPATDDNADVLKFSEDFFTGLTMEDLLSDDSSTIGKFITVNYDEESQTATISVDRDGDASNHYTSETLLHLTNQDTEIKLDDLLANNQIVIG